MHVAMTTFHRRGNAFALSVRVKAPALKKLFDARPLARQKRISADDGGF